MRLLAFRKRLYTFSLRKRRYTIRDVDEVCTGSVWSCFRRRPCPRPPRSGQQLLFHPALPPVDPAVHAFLLGLPHSAAAAPVKPAPKW